MTIKRFALLFLCIPCLGFALAQNTYIVDNRDGLIVPKSVAFIEQLSSELFTQTSFSLFVAAIDQTPLASELNPEQAREQYKKTLIHALPKPYTIIVFMKNDQKIDIISSDPDTFLNEFRIFMEYMVPLLPKQNDEILSPERISAIILNGYVEAADMVASHFGITLEHDFRTNDIGGREFVRVSMYLMLLIMFGTLGFIYLKRKK